MTAQIALWQAAGLDPLLRRLCLRWAVASQGLLPCAAGGKGPTDGGKPQGLRASTLRGPAALGFKGKETDPQLCFTRVERAECRAEQLDFRRIEAGRSA